MNMRMNRRECLGTLAGLCTAGLLGPGAFAADINAGGIPLRPFGKTGIKVSILGLGGHHIGRIKDAQESVRFIRKAIDLGVTFMDNAWEYHNGRSEELMGQALADGYREKVFLMTKHHGRQDKRVAMRHLEDSLRRLKVDVIDLWQIHEVVYEKDPEMIFAKGGAIEACDEAKKAGKVRFVGFTGHKDPRIHLEMLRHDYPWDAVQMPVNALDPHYRSFIKLVLPVLTQRKIAPIAMKTMAGGHLLRTATIEPVDALHFAWSQPVATIVSGMENEKFLEANVQAARDFKPLGGDRLQALLDKTREAGKDGKHEPFKTTRNYDGPVGRAIHGIG